MSLKARSIYHLAISILLVMITGCNFPGAAEVTFDPCDANRDGVVDDREVQRCAQLQQQPSTVAPTEAPAEVVIEEPAEVFMSDEMVITHVHSEGIGDVVVRLQLPETPRYPEGAPIVVSISGFFVPFVGFHESLDTTQIGAIKVDYLWPGKEDAELDVRSDGVYDHGGPDCLAALRDVIRFALGLTPDVNGKMIDELIEVTPLTDNVGLYAFSHPGIVATNVLAHHGSDIPTVKYLVGRENPTIDEMYPLELGYFDDDGKPIFNPYYYPQDYTPTCIHIDYSTIGWLQNDQFPEGRPFFAVSDGPDHVLGYKHPQMWGKDYYSAALTQALLDNGALTLENWPEDLATPEETRTNWPFRTTVHNYALLTTSAPDLKVMLVFARRDHVQAAPDKPHIRQAFDGFHEAAGLWVRLNPDLAYVRSMMGIEEEAGFPDNPANTEPNDWMNAGNWGYPGPVGGGPFNVLVPLASVAEMADRVRNGDWSDNLETVLFE
jgi:hypothetical protein